MKEEYKKVFEFLQRNEKITRDDVESLLDVRRNNAVNILNELVNRNMIIKEGKGKNIIYRL